MEEGPALPRNPRQVSGPSLSCMDRGPSGDAVLGLQTQAGEITLPKSEEQRAGVLTYPELYSVDKIQST